MKKILVLFLLSALGLGGQVNLDSCLVACYALNSNGYEPIHGFHGTLNNTAATSDRFNSGNKSLFFSSNANVELPEDPLFKPAAISFSGWIRLSTGIPSYIVHTMNSFGLPAYSLRVENNGTANVLEAKKCAYSN